jgi:nucleotide-binding universal stress UspA family protein
VPTVVVPTTWTPSPIERVVVGFDGSEHARDAVHWTSGFVDAAAEVRALIAIEIAPWLQEDIVHVRLGDDVQAEERRLLELLAAADPDGRTRPDVVVRGARPALVRAAETADLVVVGAHGAGRIGTSVLGSVSTWMLDGSPVPVVVVPSAPHDAPPEAAHEKGTE